MAKLVVEGGHRLEGTVRINGAKNSALKLMAGAMLGQGAFTISDVPDIADVRTMCGVLESLGVETEFEANELRLTVGMLRGASRRIGQVYAGVHSSYGSSPCKLGCQSLLPGGCAVVLVH